MPPILRPGWALGQSMTVRVRGSLRAVRARRLAQDAADVVRGGVSADEQLFADLAVRETTRDQLKGFGLAWGETLGRRGGGDARADPVRPRPERRHFRAP